MRIGVVLLWLLLAGENAWAQQGFTMETYLQTAYLDQSLERYKAQLGFMEGNNFNSPWLSRVEFRIGSEDANVSLNEYRLRLTAGNPAEIKANKLYYQKQMSSITANYEIAVNDALKNRYQLLIEHYYYAHLVRLCRGNSDLMNELMSQVDLWNTQKLDVKDVIEMEEDVSKLMIDEQDFEGTLNETTFLMMLDVPDAQRIEWDSLPMISVAEIADFIEADNLLQEEQNMFVQEAKQAYQLREQLVKISKAESKNNLGYIQGNFDSDKGDVLSEHLGFQIGVRIPIVNPDKPDINRDRFDLIKDQKKVDETRELVSRQSELLQARLTQLMAQYFLIQQRLDRANGITINSEGLDDQSVLALLKKTSYILDLNRMLLKVQRNIFESYIDYLSMRGFLVKSPVINYLSSGFTIIR